MKQQVLVIHGGTSFDSYEEYIDFIKTRELTKEKLRECADWRSSLSRGLGDDFEVFLPKMPNATNAKYAEWCIWLERCFPFLHDNIILIGHSLGGIFLAKYLAEHSFPNTILAVMLVAAPFNDTSTPESLRDFALPASLELLSSQPQNLYLVHSEDDPVVPFEQMKKYQDMLPKAKPLEFEKQGHFNQEQFPELVTVIQSLV